MNTGVVIILVILFILILAGIGVGLYFLLRPKKTPSGCTGSGCTGTDPTSFTNLIPVGCTGSGCTSPPCVGCTPGPVNGPTGVGGFTGTVPTSWANYIGGIALNNISEHDNITSLIACQSLCIADSTCQMVQFDQPNSRCFLQRFTDSPGTNVSLLTPDQLSWFHYKDKQINENVVNNYTEIDEDSCRAACKTYIQSNAQFNNQVLAEYNSSIKNCLCIASTVLTTESYLIK